MCVLVVDASLSRGLGRMRNSRVKNTIHEGFQQVRVWERLGHRGQRPSCDNNRGSNPTLANTRDSPQVKMLTLLLCSVFLAT